MKIGDVVNGRYELLQELTPGPHGSGWTSFKAQDSQGNLFVVADPECSSCEKMVAAGSDFCEWCGGSFKESSGFQ